MNSFALIFGTYWPSESVVHKLDARIKLTCLLAVFIVVFQLDSPAAFGLLALMLVILHALAHIPLRVAWKAAAPLLFLALFAMIINVFFRTGDVVYAAWGPFCISQEGLLSALVAAVRLIIVLFSSCFLLLTTTTLDVTDALENMLAPLRHLRVPVREIALMMGIVFRFLPQLAEEAFILMRAQTNRGAVFSINPFDRGTAGIFSLVSGVFSSAMRRVDTLAAAMDSRCYNGAEGRTRLNPLSLTKSDAAASLFIVAFLAGALLLQFYC